LVIIPAVVDDLGQWGGSMPELLALCGGRLELADLL
jgi:hypothetical protein